MKFVTKHSAMRIRKRISCHIETINFFDRMIIKGELPF